MDLQMKLLLIGSFICAIYLITGCTKDPVQREYTRPSNLDHHYTRHQKHEGHPLPPQEFPQQ